MNTIPNTNATATSTFPLPPYTITDQPAYSPAPGWQSWPSWHISMPAEAPSIPPTPPDDTKTIFVSPDDLEALIRRVIREELKLHGTRQPSTKDVANEVLAELAKQARARGRQ